MPAGWKATAAQSHIWRLDLKADYGSAIAPCHASVRGHRTLLLPFWGQRAPAFRPGGEWPSPLALLEHPCSTAGRRTGADPVWGGLRASALCTPCRVCAAFRWASRQRVQQARSTPVARRLAIHPDASEFRRTPGKSLGIMSFSREAPGFRHGECHGLCLDALRTSRAGNTPADPELELAALAGLAISEYMQARHGAALQFLDEATTLLPLAPTCRREVGELEWV